MRVRLLISGFLLLLGFPVLVIKDKLVVVRVLTVIGIDGTRAPAVLGGVRDDVRKDGCTGIASDFAPVWPDGRNRR
jgi:hypothetical protein